MRLRTKTKSLGRDQGGAMSLTVSQMFLGAISIGIGLMRGTDAYAAFHHEAVVGHANYGASKMAHDHGRAANVVVNDNVIMTAVMGPRFGVEADNITMDANAAIACPTCPKGALCKICRQYQQNKPRALTKLAWVRAKQLALWGTLGKLSGDIDKLAAQQAEGLIKGDVARADAKVSMQLSDPGKSGDLWGGNNANVACKLAKDDTLKSPVLGHAFPTLISPNLLGGLPKALVTAMPGKICGGGGGGGGEEKPKFPEIPQVAQKTQKDCRELEAQLKCAVAAARGAAGACGDDGNVAAEVSDLSDVMSTSGADVVLPSTVTPYVDCRAATTAAPLDARGGGYAYRNKSGAVVTCAFDRDKCADKRLEENSNDFLKKELGLPKVIGNLAASLGGSETRKPSSGGSSPKNFCACAHGKKPVDSTVVGITDAIRRIASFGQAGESQALRQQREYGACGKWYFPDKKGQFASVKEDEQPFVGAWKWSLVSECQGGGQ